MCHRELPPAPYIGSEIYSTSPKKRPHNAHILLWGHYPDLPRKFRKSRQLSLSVAKEVRRDPTFSMIAADLGKASIASEVRRPSTWLDRCQSFRSPGC